MHTLSRNTVLASTFLLGLILLAGCNTTPTPPPEFVYEVTGMVVVDPNLEGSLISRSFRTAAQVYGEGKIESAAQVHLGPYQLSFMTRQFNLDSVYAYSSDNSYALADSTVKLLMTVDSSYADTVIVSVPDSFSITNIVPADHLVQGLQPVSVEWSGSTGAMTYVVAAVKNDSAYAIDGYSAFVDNQSTSFTIPPEAFAMDNGLDPDTGLYVIYVYALSGAPDSTMALNFLPTVLPANFTGNIATAKTAGSFGAVMITPYDTVRVTVQP